MTKKVSDMDIAVMDLVKLVKETNQLLHTQIILCVKVAIKTIC